MAGDILIAGKHFHVIKCLTPEDSSRGDIACDSVDGCRSVGSSASFRSADPLG